jgi:5'-nucleotidase / UDP-sugar diphosphatase
MESKPMASTVLSHAQGRIRCAALALAAALLLTACDGDDGNDGNDGADGADGFNSLSSTVEIPVGDAQCPGGGLLLQTGLDTNRNGTLDPAEVQSTTTITCETSSIAFTLSILHANDGESKVISDGDFGGLDRFATRVLQLRQAATAFDPTNRTPRGAITVTSGDNFLASPAITAGFDNHDAGGRIFDAIALDYIGFDAMAIGNHDLDFGPDRLADFIGDHVGSQVPFLSANLDFSNETTEMQSLVAAGRIAASVVVETAGEQVGIIGATTERLPFISSPRNILIGDVATAVQAEIDALIAAGVDKIVLVSHLQSIDEELALIAGLTGLDVAIAGGGDELLANDDDLLVPGDTASGTYPLIAMDADGREVPVVTTAGNYEYVGRLVVHFDYNGEIVAIDEVSGPVRVAGGAEPDAVLPDPFVQQQVVEPVAAFQADLAANLIVPAAGCEVDLDGQRGAVTSSPFAIITPGVRNSETNEGSLIADALLWQGRQLAASFGAPLPIVGLQNGGGIRNDDIIPCTTAGLTELDTFDMVPFANFVSIIQIPREQFKEVMENAVSRIENGDGRFAQVSGFSFSFDRNGTAQLLDAEGNVTTPGSRIVGLTLDDGTVVVSGGAVQPGADIVIATIDFLARGGDQYPYRGADFTNVGVSYQQAVLNFVVAAAADGGLEGAILAADYPEGGSGRISDVTTP